MHIYSLYIKVIELESGESYSYGRVDHKFLLFSMRRSPQSDLLLGVIPRVVELSERLERPYMQRLGRLCLRWRGIRLQGVMYIL